MDLCLVARGNEQWYCPSDQADVWAAQGCTVYRLTPTRIAGPEQEIDEDNPTLTGSASSNGAVPGEGHTNLEAQPSVANEQGGNR